MNASEKIQAQSKFCSENNIPRFAPKTGICYHCSKQIYYNISDEKASSDLIVSCPYCNKSFC